MANIKISELTALTPPAAADELPVVDVTATSTKKTTVGEIVGIINGDVDVANDGTATISELPVSKLQDGDARQLLQTDAAGTGVEWTSNVDVPGTLDVTGATALDLTLGVTGQSTLASAAVSDLTSGRVVLAGTSGELEDSAGLTFNGTQLDVDGNVIITGDLTVEGTTTTIESETLTVKDKNIELGVVASPTDVTADGGGITLKGATDKTINWVDSTDAWTLSEHVNIASAKEYRIAGTKVLDATSLGSAVVSSSLTSVGTIGTGTWQGTAITDTYLATIATAGKVSNSATTADSANTASAIVARDASGNFSAGTITAALTGNASTATALQTARTIGGVLFDGTAHINLPGVNTAGNQDTTGNAATVTTNADLTGDVTSVGNATSIASGVIVDADVNASAAIAGTKIAPNFGSQTITTTGIISPALGTAAAPSIAFAGDSNTGIYSPGADQVAVSTGGTEALRTTSAGLVGIGTSSPSEKLDVYAGSLSVGSHYVATVNTDYKIRLRSVGPNNNNNYTGEIGVDGSGPQPADSDITFATQTWDGSTYVITEKARLTATGRLGIGTTSPATTLDVNGDVTITDKIIHGGNTNTAIRFPAADTVSVETGGSERVRIDSDGRLLVGASADSGGALLQVNGDRIRVATAKTPASATATGTAGEICWDADYIYVCTATNTWKRTAISTW